MATINFNKITFNNFKWLNEPPNWVVSNDILNVTTKISDFWQKTYYGFRYNSGHLYGVSFKEDFTFMICVEAEFNTLYDQAGLMVYVDDTHWLKAGLEYNDGQPMVSCVLTNGVSDWSTGIFDGNPRKFWLRLTKLKDVICVKYSKDGDRWTLLRLCPFPIPFTKQTREPFACFVGPMACSPKRDGLKVRFSGLSVTAPAKDILHSI